MVNVDGIDVMIDRRAPEVINEYQRGWVHRYDVYRLADHAKLGSICIVSTRPSGGRELARWVETQDGRRVVNGNVHDIVAAVRS